MDGFDAVVVGGGPAGLAGALYIARFRRSVLVLDDGDSRAARIPRSHNVAGFADGIAGAALVALMRRQAQAVWARLQHARVEQISRCGDGFTLRVQAAGGVETVAARCVLLATGALDIEPPMPRVAQALAEGALRYCPVCDGYEVAGQRVGVLCDAPSGLHEAFYLRHFTPDVSVFVTRAGIAFDEADRRRLADAAVALHEQPASELCLRGGRVEVQHGGQRSVCDALYSALGMQVHSGLAAALGADTDAEGYLLTDRHQQTTVPGLYSAGDVARGLNQISVGIGAAAIAASAMHLRLGAGLRGGGATPEPARSAPSVPTLPSVPAR